MQDGEHPRGLDMLRRVLRIAELLLPHEALCEPGPDKDIEIELDSTENTESTSCCKVERDDFEA
jgi:hypothetical protein